MPKIKEIIVRVSELERTVIELGRRYDHGVTQITFDASDWRADYPDGTLVGYAKAPDDLTYPIAIDADGKWLITRADTRCAGQGRVQIELISLEGETMRSAIGGIRIMPSINTDDPPQEIIPWMNEVVKAENARETAEEKRQQAEESRATAETARANAENNRATAEQKRDEAESARKQAEEKRQQAEESRATAETARNEAFRKFEALEARATQLPSGSQPTADFRDEQNHKVLMLGIPEGERGRPGDTGATPQITFTVKTGKPGTPAEIAQSGTAENPKLVLTIPRGADGKDAPQIDDSAVTETNPWSSMKTVDALCPKFSATGNPVMAEPVENYPLQITASWKPRQEGAGDPSPENIRPIVGRDAVQVTRCGENLCPYGTAEFVGVYMNPMPAFLPAGEYRFTAEAQSEDKEAAESLIYFFDTKQNRGTATTKILHDGLRRSASIKIKEPFNAIYLYASIGHQQSQGKKATFKNITLTTNNNTEYDSYTGTTATIEFPRTIYGGDVDAVTGQGAETWGFVTLDGTGATHIYSNIFYINIGDNPKPVQTGQSGICSHSDYGVYAKGKYGITSKGDSCVYVPNGDYPITDDGLAQWQNFLKQQYAAGTPVQIAYKLADPVPFTATGGQKMTAIAGVNTIMTDADGVSVTGRGNVIGAVNDLTKRVQALEDAQHDVVRFSTQTLTPNQQAQARKNIGAIGADDMGSKADVLDVLFKLPRTGKVYTVKIPKYAANPTTACEKLDDNAGLVCEPSTDTQTGRDDYENIPLFRWYNCNYLRDANGHAYPTAIEGLDDNYTTTGAVDVGVIQMTPYVRWDASPEDRVLLSITDTPREGYVPWCTAVADGKTRPYVIHSKYISTLATDGNLRSLPNAKPERRQSHNSLITNYAKKGAGYTGAGAERNAWRVVFMLIKYAQKSSQNVLGGCSAYNLQYEASVEREEKLTYFPVTAAQAKNIVVGSNVSVGYGYVSADKVNLDRNNDNLHKYADSARVLRIEPIDESNSAVYLDVATGFDTMPVALNETLTSKVVLSTMPWYSGSTDSVRGHHDGSAQSNTNMVMPYRVQGVEYDVGGYTVPSDMVIAFNADGGKDVLVCPAGTPHTSREDDIRKTYRNVGSFDGGDYYIGDLGFDPVSCATFPLTKGSGSVTGVGDYVYGGGEAAAGVLREALQGGYLGSGLGAGFGLLNCGNWLGNGNWVCLSAD